MRELVLLMVAVLALGYCFSGEEPAPDSTGPIRGWHEDLWQARPGASARVPHQGPGSAP